MDAVRSVLFEVIAVADSSKLTTVPLDVPWHGLPGSMHIAPNGGQLALIAPGRKMLFLLSLDVHAAPRIDDYQHLGAGVQLLACSWTSDSERVVVAISSGSILLLDRSLQLVREFSNASFGPCSVVDIACTGSDDVLLLTSDSQIKGLDLATGAQLFVENVQKLQPRALAFCLGTETILVASSRRSSPHVAIFAWRYQDRRPTKLFQLNADYGPASTLELPQIAPPPWTISFSPLAEYAAIAVTGHKVVIMDLAKRAEVEPFQKFGGQEVKTPAGLTYYARESVRNVASLCWWSTSCLGISDTYGSVALATLPGYVNVLGTKPKQCTPGTVVACVQRLERKALFALEPIVATPTNEAAGSRKSQAGGGRKRGKGAADASGPRLQGWRLVKYEERTPDEMMAVHLRQKEWDAAADVARAHGLNGDLIFQARWAARPADESNIKDNLAHMKDRKWVVEECLNRLGPTVEAQRQLLKCGLAETEELAKMCYGHEDQAMEYYWAIVKRVQLLQHRERLDTLLAILQNAYDPAAYEAFRGLGLLQAGAAYAEAGNLFAVQQLLQRHASLRLHVCQLLSALPETLEPHLFASLLPKVDGGFALTVEPGAAPDWVETLESVQILRFMGYENLVQATEALAALQGQLSPTNQQLEEWFCQRAVEIDERSGQLQLAVSLLELGQQRGFKGRVPLLQHLATCLLRAITSTNIAGSSPAAEHSWHVGLQDFVGMPEAEQLALLLRNSSEESVADDITSRVLPYVQGLPGDSQSLLLEAVLEGNINQRLGWCVRLVDLECIQPVLYNDPTLLAKAVIKGLLVCKSSSQWSQLQAMVESVMRRLNSALYREDADTCQDLLNQCSAWSGCIKAAQLLSKQGLVLTLSEVYTADHTACLKAVQQLLARAVRSGRQRSDKDWQHLWKDLHAVQSAGMPKVTGREVLELYVRALLAAGRFHLASGYLHGADGVELSQATSEEMVVKEALHFLYSAASLEDDNITVARRCLDLVPEAQAGKQLADTIQAITELPHWGVSLLPIQLKQLTDRLQVVDLILAAKPSAYRQLPGVLRLAGMLGVEEEDQMHQVRLKVASAAVKAEAVDLAADIAQQVAEASYAPGWDLCAELGRDKRVSDREQRRALLVFALTVCPDRNLGQLVGDLKALSAEQGKPAPASTPPLTTAILNTGCHSPEASDLPSITHQLLALPGEDSVAAILTELEAKCAADFAQLQRVLMMGVYVHALKSLSVADGGSVTRENLVKAQKLLQLPLAELVLEAQQRAPAARSTFHMTQFRDKLETARNKRKLQQLLPHMDTSKDDVASQRESTMQLASLAGQVALQEDESDGLTSAAAINGVVHESREAQKLLQQARALATQCGVRDWEVTMTYVQSLVVAAADPASSQVAKVVDPHKAELLQQPAEMLSWLYLQLYPLLPANSSPHVAATLSLMMDAVRAMPQAIPTAVLACLEKLRARLQHVPPVLSSLSMRLVAAGLVNGLMQLVLGQDIIRPLDETYSLEAFAAIYAFTDGDNVEQLASVLKDMRAVAAAAMKIAEAHQQTHAITLTVTRHLSPSLPNLCLACKLLCTPTPPSLSPVQDATPGFTHQHPTYNSPVGNSLDGRVESAQASAATVAVADEAIKACGPLWSSIGAKQLAMASSFVLGLSSRQPLREEAVGRLYPLPLRPRQKLLLLQAVLPALQGAGITGPELPKMLLPFQRLERQLLALQCVSDVDALTQVQIDAAESFLLERPLSQSLPQYLQHLLTIGCPAHGVHEVCAAVWDLWLQDHKQEEGVGLTSSAFSSALSPDGLLTGTVEAVLSQALEGIRAGMQDGSTLEDSSSLLHVDALITSLEGGDEGSLSPDVLTKLRDLLWDRLQLLCGSLEAAQLQQAAGEKLLELQSGLAAGHRWPEWHLPEGQHLRLLHARTKALLAEQWPDVQVREQDVCSCEGAESLFSLLLAASTKPRQLRLLTQLLEDVWAGGRVWQAEVCVAATGEEITPGQAAQVFVAPLHSCWKELLVSMLQDQLVEDVLRLLDKHAVHLHAQHSPLAERMDWTEIKTGDDGGDGRADKTSDERNPGPAIGGSSSTGGSVQFGGGQKGAVAGGCIHWLVDEEEFSSVIAEGDLSMSQVMGICLGMMSPYPAQVQQAYVELDRLTSEELHVDVDFLTLVLARNSLQQVLCNSRRYALVSKFLVGSVQGGGQGGSHGDEKAVGRNSLVSLASGLVGALSGYSPVGIDSVLMLLVVCVLCVEGKHGEAVGLVIQLSRLHGALATFGGGMVVLSRYLSAYSQRGLAAGQVLDHAGSRLQHVWTGLVGQLPVLLAAAQKSVDALF